MKTIDLRKQMKELWIPPVGRVVLVTVPAMPHLVIERAGNLTTPIIYEGTIRRAEIIP